MLKLYYIGHLNHNYSPVVQCDVETALYWTVKCVISHPPDSHWFKYNVACELFVVTNWNLGGGSGTLPLVLASIIFEVRLVPKL